jgi:hypothetical protein
MSDTSLDSGKEKLAPENRELVNQLALEIMEPALQKAMKSAEGKASPIEIMSALANAYGGLLIDLLGKKAAESLLRGHADHIAAREDNGISINNN